MNKGTQIAYVPEHAAGDLSHADVEFGFVMSERDDSHFCRYWRKGHPGELRTVANSELTPTSMLREHRSVDQDVVEYTIIQIEEFEQEMNNA